MRRRGRLPGGVVVGVGVVMGVVMGAGGETYRPEGGQSVGAVVRALGPHVGPVVRGWFAEARAAFPPRGLTLVVLKEERRVELWAPGAGGRPVPVHSWAVTAASGRAGPKLREGDRQVPEGLYRIAWLNPNSRFHLSLKVDYPNAFDRRAARAEGRTRLGGDIFLHGGAASIGCVALGDPAIEELFWLVATVGHERVRVLMAPFDLRDPTRVWPVDARHPWTARLYRDLAEALAPLVVPAVSPSAPPSRPRAP